MIAIFCSGALQSPARFQTERGKERKASQNHKGKKLNAFRKVVMKSVIFILVFSFIFLVNSSVLTKAQTIAPTPSPSPTPNNTNNSATQTASNDTQNSNKTKTETQPTLVQNVSAATTTDTTKPKTKEPLIHLGDTIEIFVLRNPEFNWRGQIPSDGLLPSLPYVEETIRAVCRTEAEVAQDLAKAYSKYLKDPTVTVRIVDRAGRSPAIMLGAINTPQRFVLGRAVRLAELIAISGGITEKASGNIQIYRAQQNLCVQETTAENQVRMIKISDLLSGKEDMNPVINSGDIVTIQEAEPVYVIGGVVSPQAVSFREGLSVTRAIATVGGLSKGGRGNEVVIYRRVTDPTDKSIIEINLEAIKKGKAEDILLKPYDIIDVPQSRRGKERRTLSQEEQEALIKPKPSSSLPLRVIN